jgi:hypothetical protein
MYLGIESRQENPFNPWKFLDSFLIETVEVCIYSMEKAAQSFEQKITGWIYSNCLIST